MSDITDRAAELAKAHPFGEVLENAFLGFFHVLGRVTGGFVLGVSWIAFHSWTLLFVVWLAFSDGFKRAARVQPKPALPPGTPESAPPLNGMPGTHLLDDPRYADHTTPFGVPFGPNVHGSHE